MGYSLLSILNVSTEQVHSVALALYKVQFVLHLAHPILSCECDSLLLSEFHCLFHLFCLVFHVMKITNLNSQSHV